MCSVLRGPAGVPALGSHPLGILTRQPERWNNLGNIWRERRRMQRTQRRVALLIAGLVVCGMAALASSSWALTPRIYILRHPKREHCKAHYWKKVLTVKKRIHGHTKKLRVTVCVHVPPKPPARALSPQPTIPAPISTPAPVPAPVSAPPERAPREPKPREPKPKAGCTSTFTGAQDNAWGSAANWTEGVPSGFSSYGCIPLGYPNTVTFSTNAETPTEIGGLSADNFEGITLQSGNLTLANPEQKSLIKNVQPGDTAVTLDEGVILELTGKNGELGGNVWNGPGTLEIPKGATLRTGQCRRWGGEGETRCVGGTPTPGHGGLQVRNFGTIYGAGISLCGNGAAQPAKLENEGKIKMYLSGGFGGASGCGEVGPVVNGEDGEIAFAVLEGFGCGVQTNISSLINKGLVRVGGCNRSETEQVKRPELEIGSSLSEAGAIRDGGIVQIQGDYTPTASSNLTIGISQTFPEGSPDTNYGTVKVSGSATLAGELNVATSEYLNFAPILGQTFQVLEVGGSLSGEFTLGNQCIPLSPGEGYNVSYKFGGKGFVTLEAAEVAGC